MLSETSPRSCVLPLCISHCWRPNLSGQSGVSSETSASLLECPRENSSPSREATDGRRPSSITAPSPSLKLKALCLVSSSFDKYQMSISDSRTQNICKQPGEDRQAGSKKAYFIHSSTKSSSSDGHLLPVICTICVTFDGDRCSIK